MARRGRVVRSTAGTVDMAAVLRDMGELRKLIGERGMAQLTEGEKASMFSRAMRRHGATVRERTLPSG